MKRVAARVAVAVPTLFLVTLVAFAFVRLLPGEPRGAGIEEPGPGLTAERIAELRAQFHLDEPIASQYVRWLSDVARGDLGRSFAARRPVGELLRDRAGPTVLLNALAIVATLGIAVPLGAMCAARPGSALDRWTERATYALYGLPVFWVALLLQIGFAVRLDWFPLYGLYSEGAEAHGLVVRALDRAAHLVLPVICLSYPGIAFVVRFVRANLIESALPEAARAARARGVSSAGLVVRHGFRQASVPLLTLAAVLLPALVSGSVIVERVFSIPGLGMLFLEAVLERDLPIVMAMTLLSGVATLAGIVIADVLYAVLDPRVRRA